MFKIAAILLVAAAGWAAGLCGDGIAGDLADSVSQYGYRRINEREIPKAMARLDAADAGTLAKETALAWNLVRFGVEREIGALRSIDEISTGSAAALAAVADRVRQWELYGQALKTQIQGYAAAKAKRLGTASPEEPEADDLRARYAKIVPAYTPETRGKEFNLSRFEPYAKYIKEHPDALKSIGLTSGQTTAVLNFVNGRNSITEIRDDASAELDADLPLQAVAAYLEMLAATGYINRNRVGL